MATDRSERILMYGVVRLGFLEGLKWKGLEVWEGLINLTKTDY